MSSTHRRRAVRIAAVVAVAPLVTALAASAGAALPPRATSHQEALNGVAAWSGGAWAVGDVSTGVTSQLLIVRWNGHQWRTTAAPQLGASGNGVLLSVAQRGGSEAWAVGSVGSTSFKRQTLVLHWTGASWTRVPSPSPGPTSALTGVSVLSPSDAWAVGYSAVTGKVDTPVIEHWDGSSWTLVNCPNPGSASLTSVAATSANSAWAVGRYVAKSGAPATLIVHWNGTSWARVQSANPPKGATLYSLNGVAASASGAWAVGTDSKGSLALRWNGRSWTSVRIPSAPAGHRYRLFGVSMVSTHALWAAGSSFNVRSGKSTTLTLKWNGGAWSVVPSPGPGTLLGGTDELLGVSAVSTASAWSVGSHGSRTSYTNSYGFSIRWTGTTWVREATP
jgi:hypothetical protein